MVQGPMLLVILAIAIVMIVVLISRFKVHAFLALLLAAFFVGLAAGMSPVEVTKAVMKGFGGTAEKIGIVIIAGTIIGVFLEKTGAALTMAETVLKCVGPKRPALAMSIIGYITSIPVFCDSGFVILNPIRKALVRKTAASSVMMTMALSGGLYISHVFIPPTPGPIAAANTLGVGDNLLLVMGMGLLVSIFPFVTLAFVARWLGRREKAEDEFDEDVVGETYEELRAAFGKLPSGLLTLGPIVLPILLMALGSVSNAMKWPGLAGQICGFLGTPVIALSFGVLVGVGTLVAAGKLDRFYELTEETLKTVGPILFITAAGGVLGRVIAATTMVDYIKENAAVLSTFGIFFPFLLSAILKTAQGSSTVALVTTAGILAPMLDVLGMDTPVLVTLCVMAIAAGAMTVSHANDSYFWVVTKFGAMQPQQGYRTQTVMTLFLGVASMVEIFLLWLILR